MRHLRRIVLSVALTTLFRVVSHSQLTSKELPRYEINGLFDSIIAAPNPELINGSEYFVPFNGGITNPFYGSLQLMSSELWYIGQYFPNIFLLYDIYSDKLVLRNKDKSGLYAMVELDQSKVEAFTLYSHHFKKMINPNFSTKNGYEGFYDVLYEGVSISLVSKRLKVENQTNTRVEYKQDDLFFIVVRGKWKLIKGFRSFLDLDETDEIKRFVKEKNIRTNRLEESDMKVISVFCDNLTLRSSRNE
jgi:hypothetical protein